MKQKWVELPLCIEGVVRRLGMGPDWPTEVEWVVPWLESEPVVSDVDLTGLAPSQQARLRRLIALDGSPTGSWLARSACAAARSGRVALAIRLARFWSQAMEPDPHSSARGRRILGVEMRRCDVVRQWQREWPSGTFHLEDQPAWLILPIIRRIREWSDRDDLEIHSGGHLMSPQQLTWYVPAGQHRPSNVVAVGDLSCAAS